MGKSWGRVLAPAVIIAATPLLIWNGFVQQVDASWGDVLLRLAGSPAAASLHQVVLAAIDDETASRCGPLPLRRALLAQGLEKLSRGEPAVLALDVLVAEAGEPAGDAALAAALRLFPRRVLAGSLESDGRRWILPLPALRQGAVMAHVHPAVDPDGTVRRAWLETEAAGRRLWALALEAARLANGAERPRETREALEMGNLRIPASGVGRPVVVRYAGPELTFARISFAAVMEGRIPPERFRGKIVIVGVTAQGSGDRHFTPFSVMSGPEIHANVVRAILDGDFPRSLGPGWELAISAAIVLACLVAVRRLRGARLALGLVAGAVAIPLACYAGLRHGLVLPPASFATVFVAASVVLGAGEYAAVAAALGREQVKRREYAFRVQAIAHELKTPLTAIQGGSELISESLVPEAQRAEMAGLIYKESKRLSGIIQTFLDVERIAAGSLDLDRRAVELEPLCAEVLDRARLYAARKRTRIEAHIAGGTIQADPDLLSFALYNLLTNAVKYSPAGSTVVMEAAPAAGGVGITVADQGYGIAPDEQERIFQRFYRLQRDRAGAEPGAGIGLALVKEIVEQHGGRIAVASKPGAGSRFTVTLPGEMHA
ncbi:MAG TPA: CHASE2 domain-containing protein [Bryobacteraceae bacterium]|nr:CHASE2 domain-containing protein [Bryobacteraceae bacterium]